MRTAMTKRVSASAAALDPPRSPLGRAAGLPHAGVTLVELLVTIAIVGLLAGGGGRAVRRAPEPSEAERLLAAVSDARRTALRERRPVTIEIRLDGSARAATALPDGRVIADGAVRRQLGIDMLTGVVVGPEQGAHAR